MIGFISTSITLSLLITIIVPLLRNGLHNTVVLLLLGADDIENTASSIVA
jgi:hypothetical protein